MRPQVENGSTAGLLPRVLTTALEDVGVDRLGDDGASIRTQGAVLTFVEVYGDSVVDLLGSKSASRRDPACA